MRVKILKRLIADEGKILRNVEKNITAYCVDVTEENVDKWEEVEDSLKNEVV